MVTSTDEQSLGRLLGTDQIPEAVKQEVAIRTAWYHRAGGSGPIGILALIDALRYLNVKPPVVKRNLDGKIDWRGVPQDGSVRVEAGPLFNQWHPGTFRGFGPNGMLLVYLDEDRRVMEFRVDMVRILAEQPTVIDEISDFGKPDARASLLEKPKAEVVVTSESPVEASEPVTEENPVFEQGEDEDVESPFDWRAVEVGSPVYATIDGNSVEGTFKGIREDKILVSVKGRKGFPNAVPMVDVQIAAVPTAS